MNKKLKVSTTFVDTIISIWNSLPYLIIFTLIYNTATILIFRPLIKVVLRLFMTLKGYPVLINKEVFDFFISITGIIGTIIALSIAAVLIYYEFACILFLVKTRQQTGKNKMLYSMERAVFSLTNLLNKQTIGFFFYSIFFLPFFSLGMNPALIPSIDIPNFITNEIAKHKGSEYLIIALVIIGTLLALRLALVFPIMIYQKKPFIDAAKESFSLTKGNSLRLLLLLLLIAIVAIAAIFIPVGLIMQIRGVLFLPFKVLTVIFLAVTTAILPTTMICSALTCYEKLAGEFSLTEDIRVDRLESSLKKFAEKISALFEKIGQWVENHLPAIFSKRPYILVIILLVPTILLLDIFIPLQFEQQPPLIIGHRGSLEGVENTIDAIEGAVNQGADYAEIDILLSSDGVPMVIHDTKLNRLAGSSLKVYQLTADELSEIGLNDRGYVGKIPTLEEVCIFSKDKINLLIELKTHGYEEHSVMEKTMEVISRTNMEDHVLYQTGELELFSQIKEDFPQQEIGYIIFGYIGKLTTTKILRLGASFLSVEESLVSSSLVKATHRAGKPIYVWTVNDPQSVEGLADMGIDGYITDYPEDIKDALEREISTNKNPFSSLFNHYFFPLISV